MNALGGFMAGSIVAKLLLDKTGWNDSIKSVKKDQQGIESGAKAVTAKLEELGGRMAKLGATMTKAITLPLAAIGAASVKLAMDAVESENLFEVSMGNMAEAARDWSKEMSKSLGLNQYETRKTIGVFDVMLKSMGHGEQAAYDMAKGLTQLGYDMASFYNLRADEAFEKLRAGISGEVEPLKRLGIIVNETTIKTWAMTNGLIKQGQVLTEDQKVWARYNVIMEQTKLAQGDLARTIDSPANQLRILKSRAQELAVELGTQLLPLVMKVVSAIQGGVRWFQGLSEGTKSLAVNMGLMAAALGPLLSMLGRTIALLANMRIATMAAAAAWGALAFEVAKYVDLLNQVADAEARALAADVTNAEARGRITKQLMDAATRTAELVAANRDLAASEIVTTARIDEIVASFSRFGEQAEVMAKRAILAGQFGPVLADALRAVVAEERAVFDASRNAATGIEAVGEAGASIVGRIQAAGAAIEGLRLSLAGVRSAWEENIERLVPDMGMLWEPGSLFADAIDTEAQLGLGILDEFVAAGQAKLAEATAKAQEEFTRQQAIRNQIMADIASGFESIMDGSKSMGEIFSSIITKMIADMGKLVIAEMMMAKKSILASQMEAVAKYIASVFKSVPFPFNIALAAGGFAVVSKLFKALFKFDEGGYFKKKSIIPMAQVAENEPEFIAPESKLIEAVRTAMAMPMPVPAMMPALAGGGGGGGGVVVNLNGPLIQTTGVSRRDLMAASEDLAYMVQKQMRRVAEGRF